MKKLTGILYGITIALSANAQQRLFKSNAVESFAKSVESILGDVPNNFRNITGELLLAEAGREHYASLLILPGAESCSVNRYHSTLDTTASWQAIMFRNEDYKPAVKEYRRLYQQLKKCRFRAIDGSVYFLDGEFEEPGDARDFLVSTLTVETADHRFRNFKIELELLYRMDEWVVHINMITKKKDSEMRPDWMQ